MHESNGRRRDAFIAAGEAESVRRRSRHCYRSAAERGAQHLLRLRTPTAEARTISLELHGDVSDRESCVMKDLCRPREKDVAVRTGILRMRRTEVLTDVTESCGAQQRIDNGVGD